MNMNLKLPNTADFFNANLDNPNFAKDIETTEGSRNKLKESPIFSGAFFLFG